MENRYRGTAVEGGQDADEVTHQKNKGFIIRYRCKSYVENTEW